MRIESCVSCTHFSRELRDNNLRFLIELKIDKDMVGEITGIFIKLRGDLFARLEPAIPSG